MLVHCKKVVNTKLGENNAAMENMSKFTHFLSEVNLYSNDMNELFLIIFMILWLIFLVIMNELFLEIMILWLIFLVIRQVNPTTVVTSSNQDERFTKVLQGRGIMKTRNVYHQTFQLLEVKFRETVQWIEILFFCEKILKIKSSEMAFPAFWEDVVISDPINCHKVTS
jgi:hypothetical protein